MSSVVDHVGAILCWGGFGVQTKYAANKAIPRTKIHTNAGDRVVGDIRNNHNGGYQLRELNTTLLVKTSSYTSIDRYFITTTSNDTTTSTLVHIRRSHILIVAVVAPPPRDQLHPMANTLQNHLQLHNGSARPGICIINGQAENVSAARPPFSYTMAVGARARAPSHT